MTKNRVEDRLDRQTAIVCDELALVRLGIVSVLRDLGFNDVVETRAARELVSLTAMESPDLVVLGVATDLPTADAGRRLLALRPRPMVVALLPPAHEDVVGYFVALGVRGIGLRAGTPDELSEITTAALKGRQMVVPGLHGALVGTVRTHRVASEGDGLLSSREREVLSFLAEGRSNREIASGLSVTLATVKSHLVRVYAKLGAANRNEALGRALALGLLG
jgi:DNA-binding NarL/FixJ family response regulator